MGQLVCATAMTACSFGAVPAPLKVLPVNRTLVAGRPAATIADQAPAVNVGPFGLCSSIANPAVAAATSAALGVLTPMPCAPAVVTPWTPGSPTVLIGGRPALNNTSQCLCAYGGVVTVTLPGQFTTMVP